MTRQTDLLYLRSALGLAEHGRYSSTPNPRVGCLIVKDGHVVGRGAHFWAGENHAEINALQEADKSAYGATAYVTLEPCSFHGRTPPCTDALIRAGIKRAVIGMVDPHPEVSGKGVEKLRSAGIEVDLLELPEAVDLNAGYVSRIILGRPRVYLKAEISLDGRTAMGSGESKWITSDDARLDAQELRANSCAIITGSGTVLQDDPRLTVREDRFQVGGRIRQPLRVVLDSNLQVSARHNIFENPGEALIVHCGKAEKQVDAVEHQCVTDIGLTEGSDESRVDLVSLLRMLGDRGCNNVLVEAGSQLLGAFIEAQLWDELVLYMAPKILGNDARSLANWSVSSMADVINGNIIEHTSLGPDIRIRVQRRV